MAVEVCYYVIGAIIGKPFLLRHPCPGQPPLVAALPPLMPRCTFVHIIYPDDNMILPNIGTGCVDNYLGTEAFLLLGISAGTYV